MNPTAFNQFVYALYAILIMCFALTLLLNVNKIISEKTFQAVITTLIVATILTGLFHFVYIKTL